MIVSRPRFSRHAAILGIGFTGLLTLGVGSRSLAQDHTADPYKPYNSMYEQYVYPSMPSDRGYTPGQGALEERSGGRRANQFQNYVEELDGVGSDPGELGSRRGGGGGGAGTPYYRAYRRFDRDFNRVYTPNQVADRSYYNDQQSRNEKYFQAMREPDARKRALLLKEFNQENLRTARGLSTNRRTAPGTTPAPAATNGRPANPSTGASARNATPQPASRVRGPSPRGRSSPVSDARSSSLLPDLGIGADTSTSAPRAPAPRPSRSPSQTLQRSELLDRDDSPTPSAPPPPPARELGDTPPPP